MTSRERILRTLRREPVEWVPVSLYDCALFPEDNWYNTQPSYARPVSHLREQTDSIVMWQPDVLRGWDGLAEARTEQQKDGSTTTHTVIHAPEGDLTQVHTSRPDLNTVWITEYPIKSTEDIAKYRSVMDRQWEIDQNKVEKAKVSDARLDEEVGDAGILMPDLIDPLGATASRFDPNFFMVTAMTELAAFHDLLGLVAGKLMTVARLYVDSGCGPMVRIPGPDKRSTL